MSETPENPTAPEPILPPAKPHAQPPVTPPPPADGGPPPPPPTGDPHHRCHHKPNRLYQAAAWVGIIAGSIFIIGSILITGMALGHDGGGHHGRGDRGDCQMDGPPMMRMHDRMGGPRFERPDRSDDGGSRTTAPTTQTPGR